MSTEYAGIIGTTELEIRGAKIPVTVDRRGYFKATVGDTPFTEHTLEALRLQLMAHTKRALVKIAIPATLLTTERFSGPTYAKPITITGVHAKDNDLLYRFEQSGAAGRLSYQETVLKPMTAEERTTYGELAGQSYAAQKALREYVKQYEFNARKAVEDAIKEATEPGPSEIAALDDGKP